MDDERLKNDGSILGKIESDFDRAIKELQEKEDKL